MKLIQIRHAYNCTLKEAKKKVLEKYPDSVIDTTNDEFKERNFYIDDVVWAKNKEDLKDRFNNCAIAIFKKTMVIVNHKTEKMHENTEGCLELYDILE